jgi:hypothetical protein
MKGKVFVMSQPKYDEWVAKYKGGAASTSLE